MRSESERNEGAWRIDVRLIGMVRVHTQRVSMSRGADRWSRERKGEEDRFDRDGRKNLEVMGGSERGIREAVRQWGRLRRVRDRDRGKRSFSIC